MSATTESPIPPRARQLKLREFMHLVGGFWHRQCASRSWLLTFAVLAVAVGEIIVQLWINEWNGWFFDMLAKKEAGKLWQVTLSFIALAGLAVALAAAGVLCRMLLQVRWRQWLTSELLDLWLSDNRYLRLLSTVGADGSNPEHRIAEDVRLSTEPVTDFVTGLVTALLTSAAFLGLLWTLGGDAAIPGTGLRVPGFMVYAVLLYALCAWLLTLFAGNGYVGLVKDRNEAEARLRYELIHLREQGMRVRLVPTNTGRAPIASALTGVASAWTRVAYRAAQMTWISYGNIIIAPVVPLLLVAPKYLADEMSLGTVMQVSLAFVQVQAALNWFVANYARLAEWYASVVRVIALEEALHDLT